MSTSIDEFFQDDLGLQEDLAQNPEVISATQLGGAPLHGTQLTQEQQDAGSSAGFEEAAAVVEAGLDAAAAADGSGGCCPPDVRSGGCAVWIGSSPQTFATPPPDPDVARRRQPPPDPSRTQRPH